VPDEVSLGEPSLIPDYSAFSEAEDKEIFAKVRIRQFAQAVLSAEAWFRVANELTSAMQLLEPDIERFWEDLRSIGFAADATTDRPSKNQKRDEPTKKNDVTSRDGLINQHMMLAGFAIENLCKGYLTDRLSREDRESVQAGVLPEALKRHDILKLVEQTGMALSEADKNLLQRITEAVYWRGRYPSATSHDRVGPFAQIGSDVRLIKALLRKLCKQVGAK
jgi:hypothetical protein